MLIILKKQKKSNILTKIENLDIINAIKNPKETQQDILLFSANVLSFISEELTEGNNE